MDSIERLQQEDSIRKAEFNSKQYFCLQDAREFLRDPLRDAESIRLPFGKELLECADAESIRKAMQKEPLSDFNNALLKTRYYKK